MFGRKKFSSKYTPAVGLVVGFALTIGFSVLATSVGTNISTADHTVTSGARIGNSGSGGHITALADNTLFVEGQSEFDDIAWFDGSLRASSTLLVTGAATLYGNLTFINVATTTIAASNAASFAIATSTADIPFMRFDTTNFRIGIGTTTPGATLTVGGAGNIYALGGLGVGVSTTTSGNIETSGSTLLGDAAADLLMINGASIIHNNVGTTTIPTNAVAWGIATSSAGEPFMRFDTTNSRIGIGTSTPGTRFSVAGNAHVSGNLVVGNNGTAVAGILHGYCDFGPAGGTAGFATINATSSGVVACQAQTPTGHSSGDKIWLTASSTASAAAQGLWIYGGIASSTANGRIQALIHNVSGANYTVATSTWQYLIIK